jgi:hypothetical protein
MRDVPDPQPRGHGAGDYEVEPAIANRQSVLQLLEMLGAPLGAPPALNAEGAIALRYGDDLTSVLAVDEQGKVFASTPVASVRIGSRLALFEAALRLNGCGDHADEGIIGYDPVRSQLEFSGCLAAEGLDADGLAAALGRFLAGAIAIRTHLADALNETSPRIPAPPH